jgi:hypothetical protein
MIISALERRSEIGLRRALGATKPHIRTQFISEAILLGLLGGTVGLALGVATTAVYAHTRHWATVIPTEAWAGGIAASYRFFDRRSQPRHHGVKPRDPKDHEEGLAPCPALRYSIRS